MALSAAKKAGEVIKAHFYQPKKIKTKSSVVDLVTEVDQQCEALIFKVTSCVQPVFSSECVARKSRLRIQTIFLSGKSVFSLVFSVFCHNLLRQPPHPLTVTHREESHSEDGVYTITVRSCVACFNFCINLLVFLCFRTSRRGS